MTGMRFDEKSFVVELDAKHKYDFLKRVEKYDDSIASAMRIAGYKRINQTERTVAFTFGEVTFSTSPWRKATKNTWACRGMARAQKVYAVFS